MRSAFQRRLARLESVTLQRRSPYSGPLSPQEFQRQVETRVRLRRESFETACQAVIAQFDDYELEALLAEFEAAENPQITAIQT